MAGFIYQRRIPYYFTDTSGVVHHSHFLKLFEEARTELFRSLGIPYSEVENEGILFVVTESYCKYSGNLKYDEVISIEVSLVHLDKASVMLGYVARNESGDQIVATGRTKLASVNRNRAVVRLPDRFAKTLSKLWKCR